MVVNIPVLRFCHNLCLLPLTYRIPDRIIFVSGLIVMIFGMIIWLPLGHDKPDVQMTGAFDIYIHCMYFVWLAFVLLMYIDSGDWRCLSPPAEKYRAGYL